MSIFKCKLISQEGCFDKKLFFYCDSISLYQFCWYPSSKSYRIRAINLQEPLPSDYTHEEIVLLTRPNTNGNIPFRLSE